MKQESENQPMRIKRIRAKNFRCLADVDLELRDFTVIIGPNGAGKSTLLDTLHVLSSVQRERSLLATYISRVGGYNCAVSNNAIGSDVELGIRVGDESRNFDYSIGLTADRGTFVIASEQLSFTDESGSILPTGVIYDRFDTQPPKPATVKKPIDGPHEGAREPTVFAFEPAHRNQPSLGKVADHEGHVARVLQTLNRTGLWHGQLFLPNERVRIPQQLQPVERPSNDGSDLLSVLYSLKTDSKQDFQLLVDVLRAADPEFVDLEFPVVGAGHVHMRWVLRNQSHEFIPAQLSDGTLRLLWLLSVLSTASDDGLLLLDEPELSLHPQWLQLVVSVMRKTSARTRIVVATQSAEFVRWVEPSELLIADIENGAARFTWADSRSDLGKWLENFTLEELWTMGELGGRR